MGATVTPIQGYLAGIFRTPDTLVGAARREQLMLNPDFALMALTNWTDDTAGTAAVTATDAKGWMERSWGVVMADEGDGKCGISQIVTLDTPITATQALSFRIHASVWAKFKLTAKTATLKISGTSTGSIDTIAGAPTAAGADYSVDDVLTVSTGSGDATVKVTAETGGAVDTVEIVADGTASYTVAAGQATTSIGIGTGCTIEVTAIQDLVLASATIALISLHPYYGDTEWGYFSVGIDALQYMEKITLEVYSEAAGAQEWYIDNIQAYVLDEIAGAYGDLSLDQNTLLENISTYATIGSHGEHVFYPASEEPSVLEIPTFYIAAESFAIDMQDGDRVFVILYTTRGTKTAARWEFFAYIGGVGINVPSKSFIKENARLQLTGIVGFADR